MSRKPENRVMPADFPANALVMSQATLRTVYNVGQVVLERWHRENGGNPRAVIRAAPEDFAEIAATKTIYRLQKHYEVGERMIKRWMRETGITPTRKTGRIPHNRRPMPEDFREVAPHRTHRALCDYYKCSRGKIIDWLKEAGVATAGYTPVERTARPAPRPFIFRGHSKTLHHADLRTITMFDQAADELRRERFVVYRCNERGRYDEKGDFWRLGNTLLTPDELLKRADKYRKAAA